jgi:hypothetical protein
MKKTILGGAGLIILSLAFSVISWTSPTTTELSNATLSRDSLYNRHVSAIYVEAHLAESGLSPLVFEKALTGYYNLKDSGKLSKDKSVLTIVDFDQKSTQKRLWIVDLDKKALLLNTWVAHGNGSGNNEATQFSNTNNSYQSSLGFYVTGDIYIGKHGRSLRLDGMDKDYNSNARSRAIVVHGADYVSQGTINALGRLGRSQGCPAVAPQFANTVINATAGKTVLFIHKSDPQYASIYLNHDKAAVFAINQDVTAGDAMAQLDSIEKDTSAAI